MATKDPYTEKGDRNAIADFLRHVQRGEENALEVAREALPDGKGERLTVALQNRTLQPEQPLDPKRQQSPRRTHVFHGPEPFVAYIDREGSDRTVVLADAPGRQIQAVLDDRATGGFEVVTCAPPLHPLFDPWAAIFGRHVPLGAFAEFIIERRSTVTDPDPRNLAMTFRQVTVAESSTMHRGQGAKSINGLVISRTIKGVKEDQTVELPDRIVITVPLLTCSEHARSLEVDLTVGMTQGEVYCIPTCAAAEVELLEEFASLVAALKFDRPETVVGSGQLAYTDWEYLPD